MYNKVYKSHPSHKLVKLLMGVELQVLVTFANVYHTISFYLLSSMLIYVFSLDCWHDLLFTLI